MKKTYNAPCFKAKDLVSKEKITTNISGDVEFTYGNGTLNEEWQ